MSVNNSFAQLAALLYPPVDSLPGAFFDTFSTCLSCCSFLECDKKGDSVSVFDLAPENDVVKISCFSCKRWMHEGCGRECVRTRAASATSATQVGEQQRYMLCSYCGAADMAAELDSLVSTS
jgi:hypothetical protein